MEIRIVGALALVLCLGACGGAGTDKPADAGSSTPVPAETEATSAGPTLPGLAANGDLTAFTCGRDTKGGWNATGTILNPAATSDYRITVVVAPTGVERPKAKRQVLPKVKKGTSTPFSVKKIPVTAGDGPSCRVQVVRFR